MREPKEGDIYEAGGNNFFILLRHDNKWWFRHLVRNYSFREGIQAIENVDNLMSYSFVCNINDVLTKVVKFDE